MPDVIAALATAPQPSAIGVLRLSGPGAAEVAQRHFRPADGRPLCAHPPRSLVYGTLLDRGGAPLDRALATYSPAPHSYTGEDTAELQCHGSPVVLSLGLEALLGSGARLALPGEFTKRAFLNGKLDLCQAEAVGDLIAAETPDAARCAAGQLEGSLSLRVDDIYRNLVDLLAHFHAVLDYPEEDIDPFTHATLADGLDAAAAQLDELAATYHRGRLLTQGASCVLLGKPNTGKSSLLNRLLGYDRAIVTPLAGTTRDTIEVRLTLGDVLLNLTDTAGIRPDGDPVEQLGVARTRSAVQDAQLVLLVLDASQPLTDQDEEVLSLALAAPRAICLLNKCDLPPAVTPADLASTFPHTIAVSAHTGQGLEELEDAVAALFPREQTFPVCLTSPRQYDAACRARRCVSAAKQALSEGVTYDAVLTDVEEALSALGELTGRTVREDVVTRIFQRFCVGK